jgi:hypothetical protein
MFIFGPRRQCKKHLSGAERLQCTCRKCMNRQFIKLNMISIFTLATRVLVFDLELFIGERGERAHTLKELTRGFLLVKL